MHAVVGITQAIPQPLLFLYQSKHCVFNFKITLIFGLVSFIILKLAVGSLLSCRASIWRESYSLIHLTCNYCFLALLPCCSVVLCTWSRLAFWQGKSWYILWSLNYFWFYSSINSTPLREKANPSIASSTIVLGPVKR